MNINVITYECLWSAKNKKRKKKKHFTVFSQNENCDCCQRNARESERKVDVLHPIPVTAKPWYMVGIDLIDAQSTTEKGNK